MTKVKSGSRLVRPLIIAAQLLALLALALGLNFLIDTTGGTLFLFASVAPALVLLAIVILAGVAIYRYNTSHHLFDIENYGPGEIVFREGDPGECAYFIHSGEVEVLRKDQGEEKILARLGQDQYFGEMALLKNAPRNATIRAVTQTQVAVLGKRNFLTLLSVMPRAKEDILQTVKARAMAASK